MIIVRTYKAATYFARMIFVTWLTSYAISIPSFSQVIDSITVNSKTGIQVEMIYIEPGRFVMGRNVSSVERFFRGYGMVVSGLNEGPAHTVEITEGFFIGRYKVTAAQYCVFLNSLPDNKHKNRLIVLNDFAIIEKGPNGKFKPKQGRDNSAIGTVPWEGANQFCRWLTEETGWTFRLPTEAEWEYSARGSGGRITPWGNDQAGEIDLQLHQPDCEYPRDTTPDGVVGMINSVGDWVSDYYADSYERGHQTDPTGPKGPQFKSGTDMGHVVRRCRNSYLERESGAEVGNTGAFGFRVVLDLEATVAKNKRKSVRSEGNQDKK